MASLIGKTEAFNITTKPTQLNKFQPLNLCAPERTEVMTKGFLAKFFPKMNWFSSVGAHSAQNALFKSVTKRKSKSCYDAIVLKLMF